MRFALALMLGLPLPGSAALELASGDPIVLKTPAEMPALYGRGQGMSAGARGRLVVKVEKEIWVWAEGPGRIERVLPSEGGPFVGMTPDGRRVAGATEYLKKKRSKWVYATAQAALWDVESEPAKPLEIFSPAADAVVSPDGTKAAFFTSGSFGNDLIRVYDLKTGKSRVAWDKPENCLPTGSVFQPYQCEGVMSVALSPDGSKALIVRSQKGGWDREATVLIVDGVSGKKLRSFPECDTTMDNGWSEARAAAWSADGRFIAYSGAPANFKPCGTVVREADTGAILWKTSEHVYGLAFSPDGAVLVGIRPNAGPPLLWDVAKGTPISPPTKEDVSQAAFAVDGSFLFLGLGGKPEIRAYRLLGGGSAAAPAVAAAPEPVESVDAPPATKMPLDPDALAVVIGVEKYRQPEIPRVEYAASDAQTVAAYLTKAMGFDARNVVLLTDEQATKTDFEKHLGPWLENRATDKSRVLIYYAGHGSPDPKSGDAFLMPYEADPTYTKVTGYPLKQLYKNLGDLPARNVIVALDSCFSGAGKRSVIAAGARPLVNVQTASPAGATVVLAAAAGDQISGSYPEGGHGLMTYFLLKGLRGAAARDKEGRITTRALYEYLRPNIEREARKRNLEQSPRLQGLSPEDPGPAWIVLP